MSQLKIVDISFCETELPNLAQVQGGISYGQASASSSAAASSGFNLYYLDPYNHSAAMGAYTNGAMAGAIAGPVSDGYQFLKTRSEERREGKEFTSRW